MSSESQLWQTTKRHLGPFGVLKRVESHATAVGMPDVVYCLGGHAGWLELKEIAAWPKRPTTPLNVPHLTRAQVIFAENWTRAGGDAYGLFQVGAEYLLISHLSLREILERRAVRASLLSATLAHGIGTFPTRDVAMILLKRGVTTCPPPLTP